MTNDNLISGCSQESEHSKYNVTPEEMKDYAMRVNQRLEVERKHTLVRFRIVLSFYNAGKLTREKVVSRVQEILKHDPDLRNEFITRLGFQRPGYSKTTYTYCPNQENWISSCSYSYNNNKFNGAGICSSDVQQNTWNRFLGETRWFFLFDPILP
ncbi:hypothetical protein KQX54_016611 [Cotesia glomerata]|uniref:Uncharacterized protein n=1 Tax=Cotesia glomerata TaxID=32391 RepID=A0AAV7IF93_COTGL|nr:hypothetical protein KQX54_016611 [Cotesia glomerata]